MSSPQQLPPARGYVDPNFPNPNGPGDATIIIYGYTPSLALSIAGCVLFALAGVVHAWQLFRYRTWYFSTVLVGIVFEIVGYAFRGLSAARDPYRVAYFVVQYFFIVVAPVFFAAALYTILSLLISATSVSSPAAISPASAARSSTNRTAVLPPRTILITFVTADVLATTIQILGAALIGSAESNRRDPTTPSQILLAGLVLQAFTFLLFILLFALFLVRVRGMSSPRIARGFYTGVGAAVLLFYLRVCFRVAETAEGVYGRLGASEGFFVGLEFVPVVMAVWVLGLWHPGRCVPGGGKGVVGGVD